MQDILSRLDRKPTELKVRRAFTSVQLITILGENNHTFSWSTNPMLYEEAGQMVEVRGPVSEADFQGSDRPPLLACIGLSSAEDDRAG